MLVSFFVLAFAAVTAAAENTCTCHNGAPATGDACTMDGAEYCVSCYADYHLLAASPSPNLVSKHYAVVFRNGKWDSSPDLDALPLERCHGDCDADHHCRTDLGYSCFQNNAHTMPPGCQGTVVEGMDYCAKDPNVCDPHTRCTATEYEIVPGTGTQDRVCKALTTCLPGQWESAAPQTAADRVCAVHTPPCASGMWQERAPGAFHDRVCRPHTTCSATQYETVAAGPFNDRACAETTVCTSTQWETVAATATSDRTCKGHTICEGAEYETKAAGVHHDRVCASHTLCTTEQYESKPAGTHQVRRLPALPPTPSPSLCICRSCCRRCWCFVRSVARRRRRRSSRSAPRTHSTSCRPCTCFCFSSTIRRIANAPR